MSRGLLQTRIALLTGRIKLDVIFFHVCCNSFLLAPLHASTPHHFDNRRSSNIALSPTNISMNFTTQLRYSSSHKHDALYFYFSRLVQPIWEKSLCRLNGLTVEYIYLFYLVFQLETAITSDEMTWLAKKIKALSGAMDKYRLLPQNEHQRRDNSLTLANGILFSLFKSQ